MDTLLSDILAFVAENKLSEWAFGEQALGDRHFIRQLRDDNREPRRATVERVRNFMRDYTKAAA
jgi:hypothetical protein